MVAAHWVKVLATETSAFRSWGIVLESSVVVSGAEDATLALASGTGSSMAT
jgi:hypothetical protein